MEGFRLLVSHPLLQVGDPFPSPRLLISCSFRRNYFGHHCPYLLALKSFACSRVDVAYWPQGSWLPGLESTGFPGSKAVEKPAFCRAADKRANAAFEIRTSGRG